MAKILVLSDTHGCTQKIKVLSSVFNKYDYVFHLGDFYADMNEFESSLGNKLYQVKGNCDLGGEPIIVTIEGVKILAVHGNKYNVKSSLNSLIYKAREEDCKLVLYGHTHASEIINYNGITIVNPGNLAKFQVNSYAVIEIDNGNVNAQIINL